MIEKQKAALEQLSIDLMAAWKNRDRDTIEQILHKDFCYVNDSIKNYWVSREKWIEWLLEKFNLVTFQYNFQKIELNCGNKMALVISKLSTLTRPNYSDAQSQYLNTDVWIRGNEKGTWKLILRQPVSSSFL